MQPTAAALCAVCLAAPLALPNGSTLASAPGQDLAASATVKLAAAVAANPAALPANPTLLEVLGLPIQTLNNIFAEGTTGAQALPPAFPLTSAQYVSVFEALNAYVKVGSTVATQLVNGQFEQIPASFQTNLAAAMTALEGLPPSIAASLQYNLGVIQAFIAGLGASAPVAAADAVTIDAKTVALSAATPAALPTNPTLLEVLGLPIQTIDNIVAEGTTGAQALPTGFPLTSAQYVSAFEVLNAYVKVGSTIATQLVNGQFEQIPASFQTNLAAANTALAGFGPSVAASLQYNLGVIQNFFTTPSATATSDAAAAGTKTLAVSAATPSALPAAPTLLDVLGLQIQTINNIAEAGTTGALALPAGFPLTAAQYVSVFAALNAYIKVGSTVATQLVNGQFEQIGPSFQTNLAAANTALAGLGPSVAASLQYDAGVIRNFITGGGATTVKAAAVNADATPTALKADVTDPVTALPDATAPKKAAPTGGFLKQLQSAVDNEVGGGKVKVAPAKGAAATGSDAGSDSSSSAPKPVKHSDTKKASGSAKSASGAASAKTAGDK